MTSRREAARAALGVYAGMALVGVGVGAYKMARAAAWPVGCQVAGLWWAIDCYITLRRSKR